MAVFVDPDYGPKAVTTAAVASPAIALPTTQRAASAAVSIPLFVGATVAGNSPVLDRGTYRGPAALVIANVGTGSPAVTINLMGSVDNVNFFNLAYGLVATPNTVAVAALAITATATTTYLLVTDQAWRYLRVDATAVTTETWTVTYYQ